MYRLRCAPLFVAAGLGLVCGCLSLSHPLFSRKHHDASAEDCCDVGALPDGDMPLGGSAGPGLPPVGPIPQNGGPDPRLQPIPQQAPTSPYRPTTSGLGKERRQETKSGDQN